MQLLLNFVLVLTCFQGVKLSDNEECVIELECEECLPEYMPAVTSHAASRGVVRVPHGEELALSCGRGHFLQVARARVTARCEAGRYRVDGALRTLLDLGCQQDVLEDVEHSVEHCAPPRQGRAYETQEGGRTRHLATLCFDADRAVPLRLRTSNARGSLPLAPHSDARAPLSLLGNFNHMFDARTRLDAERLFADDARLDRRLRQLFKHDRYSFADRKLTAGRLLAPAYFDARDVRVAEFASNKVLSWRGIVDGNLRNLHEDVAEFMTKNRGALDVEVYAGTHGVVSLNARSPRPELFLREGRRFPVARYVWTVVSAAARGEAVALVLLNDPFVTVSEIREAVFCESACGRVSWARALARHRNYERPALGLVFCCRLDEFLAHVEEMPRIFNDTVKLLT